MEKLFEITRDPQRVKLMTMVRQLPPEEEIDFEDLMRPLMKHINKA